MDTNEFTTGGNSGPAKRRPVRLSPIGQQRQKKKLPPFGKALDERQRYLNRPDLFGVICIGANCWQRVKEWQGAPNDCLPMVLPDPHPELYIWPVNLCIVTIEVAEGPSAELIERLAAILFEAGAAAVIATAAEGKPRVEDALPMIFAINRDLAPIESTPIQVSPAHSTGTPHEQP